MLELNYLYWFYFKFLWINFLGINNVLINEKFNFFLFLNMNIFLYVCMFIG